MKNTRNFIKILIAILILSLLFNYEAKFSKKIKPYGILLIDGSNSMNGLKLPEIKSKYKLKRYIFNKGDEKTEIGNAILEYIKKFPDVSFLILFSDGNNNSGIDPIDVVKKINLPVYVLLPEFTDIPEIVIKNYKDFVRIGDTLYFYISISKGSRLTIKDNEKWKLIMDLKKGTEYKVPYFSLNEGEKNISFIFESDNFADTIYKRITFLPKKKYSIYYSKPDWNVKFIKRIIEEKGFINSEKGDINIFIMNEKNQQLEKKLKDFYKENMNIFIIITYQSDIGFLPFNKFSIKKDTIRDVLFESLLPFFTIKNAKEMKYLNTTIGYFNDDYKIFQTSIIDLWKLSFTMKCLENKDYLNEIFDSVLLFMNLKDKEIFLKDTVNAGEEFYIFSRNLNKKYVLIDNTIIPFAETILVYPLKEGIHTIKFIGNDTITKNIYAKNPKEEKKGINRILLEEIIKISGGKFVNNEFNEVLPIKNKEIIINLRHSVFIYLFIIFLLSLNWYLWMKER